MDAVRRAVDDGQWEALVSALRLLDAPMRADEMLCDVAALLADVFEQGDVDGILKADVAAWLGDVLTKSHVSLPCTRRLAYAAGALASAVTTTTATGANGSLDQLGKLWVQPLAHLWKRSRGLLYEAAHALTALCASCQANRQRVMKAGCVLTASFALRSGNVQVMKSALVLLEHMSDCVPDVRRGGLQLVPIVRQAMNDATQGTWYDVAVQAFKVLSSVAKVWGKTSDGFEVGDLDVLCGEIFDACTTLQRKDVFDAAAGCVESLVEGKLLTKVPERLQRLLTRDVAVAVAGTSEGEIRKDVRLSEEKNGGGGGGVNGKKRRMMTYADNRVASKRQCTRFASARKRNKRTRWSDVNEAGDEQGADAGGDSKVKEEEKRQLQAPKKKAKKTTNKTDDEELPSPTRVFDVDRAMPMLKKR